MVVKSGKEERVAGFMLRTLVEVREPALPVTLLLNGVRLTLERLLRQLPGRRMVCAGQWGNQQIVAKVFAATDKGRRECAYEVRMLTLLHERGVPAPVILCQAEQPGVTILLLEYLNGASGRDSVSSDRKQVQNDAINGLVGLTSLMHKTGLMQADIHLDNFRYVQGRWHVVDAGGVEAPRSGVSMKAALNNLAWLLAQFPPFTLPAPEIILAVYDARSLLEGELVRRVHQVRQKRLSMIERKSMRECTEYLPVSRQDLQGMARRDRQGLAQAILEHGLDRLIDEGQSLKDGNSASVSAGAIQGVNVVIKRYNVKSFRKWVGRQWRSRAVNAWRSAAFLSALGIDTPQPLLFARRKRGVFVTEEYLVTAYVDGRTLPQVCAEGREERVVALAGMAHLYALMRLLRFSHGDSKYTNFLVRQGEVCVLDLDGMRRRVKGDIEAMIGAQEERLFRNWRVGAMVADEAREVYQACRDSVRDGLEGWL